MVKDRFFFYSEKIRDGYKKQDRPSKLDWTRYRGEFAVSLPRPVCMF